MEEIGKKVKAGLGAVSGALIIAIVLSILFIARPEFVRDVIVWVAGLVFLAIGIVLVVIDMTQHNALTAFGGSVLGVGSIILGVITLSLGNSIINLIAIVLGIFMIMSAIFRGRLSLGMSGVSTNLLIVSGVSTLITLICGIVLVVAPGASIEAVIRLIGVIMLIDSISNLINVAIVGNNVHDFEHAVEKVMKKNTSKKAAKARGEAVEAEIVEPKKKAEGKSSARKAKK